MYHGVVPANGINRAEVRVATGVSYPLADFLAEHPDDDACLDLLWRRRFAPDGHSAECPRCQRPRRFHRTRSRASYTCDSCGLHVHPMKGTVFERSTTPLRLWFYAIYLMASTGAEISAGQLERELGVSYRTARRIRTRIRAELMSAPVTTAAAELPGSAADQPPPGPEQGSGSAPRGPAGSAGAAPAP
jgi:transposase-like protein